ncbi:MAG: putative lipid II flippase FtsW [Lachnospiraceae bacterium]|nr:putative lipid II flippase FtsW [Lachnospiraceae bacterium]
MAGEAKKKKFNLLFKPELKVRPEELDLNLVGILIFLLCFGALVMFSASSSVAVRDWGSETHYLKKQLQADLIGLVLMFAMLTVPQRWYRNYFAFLYFFSCALVLLVIPFGIDSHGASRWVQIPGLGMNFQPAEAAKLFMIIFMATMIDRLGDDINELHGFGVILALPIPICAEILFITKNLSSAIIIYGICFVMGFIVSEKSKYFYAIMGAAAAAALILVLVVNNSGVSGNAGFRLRRIAAWLHPETSTDATAHQTLQGLYAIGSGGLWGKGLGQSVQKISNLPEPHNDMIFNVICEELGLVGAWALMIMFVILLWRMYTIAANAKKKYEFMLVTGVMAHIAIQTVMNIAVATNSMPNTGVSLPFVSYGGSSVLFLLIEVGIVLRVGIVNYRGEG